MSAPAPGRVFGPYELIAPIGAGGMGEVWKARDTRLDRLVAMKFSKVQFSERFEREARAVAALNHPNICTLHDVGPNFIVMEYLDGKPIAGPLPLEKAMEMAGQILDALDAAHRKGIAHRDLKPQYILVTRQGVKLLDFGLAKVAEPKTRDADETAVMGLTQENSILGTPQYMAPEQIEGKPTDARTDLFAFGLVIYELLTGEKAFEGKSATHVMAALLTAEPPPLKGLAPPAVERVLRRALEKDPEQRWQSARDLKIALGMAMEPAAEAAPARRAGWLIGAASAAVALAALCSAAAWRMRGGEPAPIPFQLSILPPEGAELPAVGRQGSEPEISPDGTAVIFEAGDKVWIRRLDSMQAQALPGIQAPIRSASWSPDGKAVAFISGAPTNAMVRLRLADGARDQILAITTPTRGASWNQNGAMLFSEGARLHAAAAAGGKAEALVEGRPSFPRFLPNGEDFMFSSPREPFGHSGTLTAGIYLATLRGGKLAGPPVLLRPNALGAQYLEAGGGSVLFVAGDDLFQQRLDLKQRKLTGDAKLIVHGVGNAPGQALADYSISTNGIMAWRPGRSPASQLTWFDRSGRELGTLGPAMDNVSSVTLSPDGRHVTTVTSLLDTATAEQVKLDFAGSFGWSPDGSAILTRSPDGDALEEHPLANLSEVKSARPVPKQGRSAWFEVAADGTMVYEDTDSIDVLHPGSASSEPIRLRIPSGEDMIGAPSISADGRWVVYGTTGIYLQAAAPGSLRQQISATGNNAVLRADGKEIVFWRDGKIWSVRVDVQGSRITVSQPEALFASNRPAGTVAGVRVFVVARDGSRILALKELPQPQPTNVLYVMALPR